MNKEAVRNLVLAVFILLGVMSIFVALGGLCRGIHELFMVGWR